MSARYMLDPLVRDDQNHGTPAQRRWPRLAIGGVVVLLAATVWAVATPPPTGQTPITDDLRDQPGPTASPDTAAPVDGPLVTPALGSDEPCTRQLSGTARPEPMIFRAEDLERMVPTRDDLGPALTGFSSDMLRHGFQGNSELEWVEVSPATTCEDLVRYGRVTGIARAFETYDGAPRRVSVSVHVFWDDGDAAAWSTAFVEGLRSMVGHPEGPTRLTTRPLSDLGSDAVLVEHAGPEGVRTWAMIRRGTVVGWVIDLRPGDAPSVDVAGVADDLARRIEEVTVTATSRPRDQLDLAQLMSVPLPLSSYGDRYEGLAWEPLWGGCADLEEWASVVGDEGAAAAREHGRVSVCTSMYSPDREAAQPHDVALLWSRIEVFPDADSASAYLQDPRRANVADGAETFDVPALAGVDEAIGARRTLDPAEDGSRWHTRIAFRRGVHVLTIAVNDRSDYDARADLAALATQLNGRLITFLELLEPSSGDS